MLPLQKLTERIITLTIMSSFGCNLRCEYCLINRARTDEQHAAELQKNTIQAFEDGTYLENVKKSFDKLDISYSQIQNIELWGQEPTLTLHHFTNHLEDWLHTFPNVDRTMFSTNGIAYPERILNYILKIDSIVSRPFEVFLQFSYDGEYSTNNLRRGASDNVIFNNIKTLLIELNKHKLKFVKVSVNVHGVLSRDVISKIQTTEDIINYYNNMGLYAVALEEYNLNGAVDFDPVVTLSLENPVQASTEEGILLGSFIQKSIRLPEEAFINHSASLSRHTVLLPSEGLQHYIAPSPATTLDEYIDFLLNSTENFQNFLEHNIEMPFCGTNTRDLHIRYDGLIITCQNYMYDTELESMSAENDREYAVKKSLIDKKLYINPLDATTEELQKFFTIFFDVKYSSYKFLLDQIICTMYWMSKAGQINRVYKDNEKVLFKHAILCTTTNCCIYNNRIKNGTLYSRWDGFIRWVCNGYLDVKEEEVNRYLNEEGLKDGTRIL